MKCTKCLGKKYEDLKTPTYKPIRIQCSHCKGTGKEPN